MLGLDSIYNTIYSYFYPEESEDAGSLNEELGTLNGYEVVRLSPDMEKGTSAQKAAETAQVILLLDLHTEKDMHEANAKVLDQFFDLEHDRLLLEGPFDINTYKNFKPDPGLFSPYTPISTKILHKATSWEPKEDMITSYDELKFITGAFSLWNLLAHSVLASRYQPELNIEHLEALYLEIRQASKDPAPLDTELKDKLKQHSVIERLLFIEDLCQKQLLLQRSAMDHISINYPKRTQSMLDKTLTPITGGRVQRVWISCGMCHGIGDFVSFDEVERFYKTLDKGKVSYVTLMKKTPASLKAKKILDSNSLSIQQNRKKYYQSRNDQIKELCEHIVKYENTCEEKIYAMGKGIAEAFYSEMSFQSDRLSKEYSMYPTADFRIKCAIMARATYSLNRIAYWARKFRENLEAKAAAA